MARRYALCIGINNYKYASGESLQFARADAESMSNVLSDKNRGCFKCRTLLDEKATREEIRNSISRLLLDPTLNEEDLILVYFAGHGGLDSAGNLVLVVHDTKFRYLEDNQAAEDVPIGYRVSVDVSTGFHIKDFEIALENTKAGTIVFIVDACFSGSSTKALSRIAYKEKSNIVFIGSCTSKQTSNEISSLSHGLFTNCFLEGLSLKPSNGDWITLQQLLTFVDSKMKQYSSQGIEVSTHYLNPNILIARNPAHRIDHEKLTEEVMELFDITGSKIIKNQERPNFFIAEQTKPLSKYYIGVLCIDNSKSELTESDVNQFVLTIETRRHQKQIDRGYLITSSSVDPLIASKIRQSLIAECHTKEELLGSVMDFHMYLRNLITQFTDIDPATPQQPPLEKFYVDLKALQPNSEKPENIYDILEQWLNSSAQKLAILGQYGSGKTAFCKKLS